MNGSSDASSRGLCTEMGRWSGIKYRRVLLVLVVVLAVGGGWAYWLWQSEPAYWQQRQSFLDQHTAQQRMALAESVEQRILAALSDVSIAGTSESAVTSNSDAKSGDSDAESGDTVFLTTDEINAWFDQRLYDWAAHQGTTIPDFITNPMLAIVGDELVIAFLYESPSMRQIFSVKCDVLLEGDQAVIQVMGVSGGRLTIPAVQTASRAVGRIQGKESEIAQMTAKIAAAFDGMVFDPILKLGQQKVLLKSFELEPDGARLVFEPASQPIYAQDH